MRSAFILTVFSLVATTALADGPPQSVTVNFTQDPLSRPDVVLEGAVLDRLSWELDRPVFPGDHPGSLTTLYDGRLPAGRLGFPLALEWNQDDVFTAATILVIHSDGFIADPFGFFQISWGLWNSATTGWQRTGVPGDFFGDTFELVEFDYFPNMSEFGGPFLSPTIFGVADESSVVFPLFGAFANLGFASVERELPLDVPLLALMEHRPQDNSMVVSVHRILHGRTTLPVPGAVTVVPLSAMPLREYGVDTFGLTLWNDGFTGEEPSLRALVTYHALLATPGPVSGPKDALNAMVGP